MQKQFLEILAEKLKGINNLRSIYLNCLPEKSATKLDIFDCNDLEVVEQKNWAESFLKNLLTKENFKCEISLNSEYQKNNANFTEQEQKNRNKFMSLKKRLSYLLSNQEDNFKEYGTRVFGFGYPCIVIEQERGEKIKAPLIIWNLNLENCKSKKDTWIIKREEDNSIFFNAALISYVENEKKIKLDNLPEEILEDKLVDKEELKEIVKSTCLKLNINSHFDCEIGEIVKSTCLKLNINSHFDCEIGKIITEEKIKNLKDDILLPSGVFGIYKQQKENILKDIKEMTKNIEDFQSGENGELRQDFLYSSIDTDPSQSSVIKSLSQKEHTIIHGPPGTGKSQTLTGIITNALVNENKILVVCEKRVALEVLERNLKEKSLDRFCVVIEDVKNDRKKIVEKARESIENSYYYQDSYDFNQTLIEYSQKTKEENKKRENIQNIILKDDEGKGKSWKDIVNIFLKNKGEEHRQKIEQYIEEDFLKFSLEELISIEKIIKNAQQKIFKTKNDYSFLNTDFFEKEFTRKKRDSFEKKFNLLEEQYNNLPNELEQIKKKSFLKIPLFSSKKYKNIFIKIQKTYEEIFNKDYINKIKLNRKNYKIHEKAFKELKKEIDDIFKKDSFETLYQWFNFYFSIKDKKAKKILNILIKHYQDEKEDWLKIFKSYYAYQFLYQKEEEVGPLIKDDENLKELEEIKENIIEQTKNKIFYYWGIKGCHKVIDGRSYKQIYNLRGSKGRRRHSLKFICNKYFDEFTDLFPVVMVTPEVACTIFPLQKDLFDLVLFDEASQLRIEDTIPAYIRGKYKIISGDEQQMPPSNYFGKDINLEDTEDEEEEDAREEAGEESLLSWVLSKQPLEKEEKWLEFHYRSEHPDLIEFSNRAFYQSKLSPMPKKQDKIPFEFIDVQGTYQNQKNETEALEIIEKIKNLYQSGEKLNIGIATFNIKQRELIKNKIREELETKILIKLEENDYFVKNLENIQGDERDIILISGTYGKKPDGKFEQRFSVNHKNGERLLNVMITRAKKKIIFFNSIPENYYLKYKDELKSGSSSRGKNLLYAYIDYVKNVAQNNRENVANILDVIGEEKKGNNEMGFTESPFEEEVLQCLLDEIPQDNIKLQYKVGGFRIDMVVKDKNGNPKIAIECDGAAYHSKSDAVEHDMYRQKIIEEKTDLIFYRIFSTNWWYDTKKEAKKLMKFIKKTQIYEK